MVRESAENRAFGLVNNCPVESSPPVGGRKLNYTDWLYGRCRARDKTGNTKHLRDKSL